MSLFRGRGDKAKERNSDKFDWKSVVNFEVLVVGESGIRVLLSSVHHAWARRIVGAIVTCANLLSKKVLLMLWFVFYY